jgi:hypothetical protein
MMELLWGYELGSLLLTFLLLTFEEDADNEQEQDFYNLS